MSEKEFVIQYVLNRARGHVGGLEGRLAVVEAQKAWKEINKIV